MKAIFTYRLNGYKAPKISVFAALCALVYKYTGIRLQPFEKALKLRRNAWNNHAAAIQRELDEQRRRGWTFRFIDGKRVDLVTE